MKTLSEFNIYEELFTEDNILKEGISLGKLGKKISALFGGKSKDKKTAEEIDNLEADDKKNVLSTQTSAIQSKDKGSIEVAKKLSEQIAGLKDKEPSKILGIYMSHGEAILRKNDDINEPNLIISIRDIIKKYGTSEKNKKAIEMVDELNELLDEKFPKKKKKAEEQVEQIEQTIDSASDQTGNNDSSESEGEDDATTTPKPEASEEITDETTEVITDNKDLLGPLVKKAGLKGEDLRDFIAYKLTYNALKDSKSKKDGSQLTRNQKAEDVTDEDVLGMCIVICGAIISGNHKRFNRIIEVIGLGGDDSKVKSAEDLKNLIADRKNWGSGAVKKK